MSDWIHLILILGAAQGFFLTILIFHKYSDLYANRFLGIIMLMMSIILIHLVLDELDVYTSEPLFKYLIETLPLLIGPMHYLYARALMHSEKYSFKVLWPHALPALTYVLYRIYFLLFSSAAYLDGEYDPVYIVYNWMINIQALIYMLIVLKMINSYTRSLKDMFAALEKIKLTWLRNISLLMTSLLIIFLTENILFLIHINFSHFFNLTSTIMAVSVYALGYMGISHSEVFLSQEIATPIRELPQTETITKNVSYEKSGLSEEKAKEYKKQLIAVVEKEQLFRDSNLTLSKVAEKLGISTHNLSEVINKQVKMNFFDFVNGYRVQQVKKDLLDKDNENLTLIAIAFDAGFNSKSSFNAIFKKHTGKTPSEFRK